jgi:hypothetical protein
MQYEEQVVDLIAALGARAEKVPSLESDKALWQRWYNEECDKVRTLRKQLEDNGMVPLV